MIVSVIFTFFALSKSEVGRIEGGILFTLLILSLIYVFKKSKDDQSEKKIIYKSNVKLILTIFVSNIMLVAGSNFCRIIYLFCGLFWCF